MNRSEMNELGERIAEHAAHLDAATHRLLTDLRTFDESGAWASQGARSCASWLSWRVGWDVRTANEHVRVANRLGKLPGIDDALRRGEMSFAKVRAMVRVATPQNEEMLLEEARYSTGAQLEKICRGYASVRRHEHETTANDDQQRRYLTRRDTADGMVKVEAVLHPEEAALVWAAIERVASERCREREDARRAEARREAEAAGEASEASGAGEIGCVEANPDILGSAEPKESPASSKRESGRECEDTREAKVARQANESGTVEVGSDRLGSAEPREGNHLAAFRATKYPTGFDRADALLTIAEQVLRGTSPDRAPIDLVLTASVEALTRPIGPGQPFADQGPAATSNSSILEVESSVVPNGAPFAAVSSDSRSSTDRSPREVVSSADGAPLAGVSASASMNSPARKIASVVTSSCVPSAADALHAKSPTIQETESSAGMSCGTVSETDPSSAASLNAAASTDDSPTVLETAPLVGRSCLLLDRDIDRAVDGGHHTPDLLGVEAEQKQVVAEQLDGDRGARAGGPVSDDPLAASSGEPNVPMHEACCKPSSSSSSACAAESPARMTAVVPTLGTYVQGRIVDPAPVGWIHPSEMFDHITIDPEEIGVLGDGTCISPMAARRLACDCGLTVVIESDHGTPITIGRKRRTIPASMKRALLRRDRTCRFPGCCTSVFLQGHHAKHWMDGGKTELRNLVSLCNFHHRYVHEYGFRAELGCDGTVRFLDARGRLLKDVPDRITHPDLGWPTILVANAELGITAGTCACGWNGGPVDYHLCVDALIAADEGRIRYPI